MQRKIFLLAYFFIYTAGIAQQYPFVHYTPKDGLVNSRVRKAYQDSKGRMYFITFGGLSVYDGARFKNYTTQNGLIVDLVNDVLEVNSDSILVAVNTCGLNVLVRGEMKKMEMSNGNCPVLNQFVKSKDGNIYASADDGLYQLQSPGLKKLSVFFPGKNEPAVYLGNIVDYKDYLVFTTNDLRRYTGLFLYNKKENKITDFLPRIIINDLKQDHTGNVWLATPADVFTLDTLSLSAGRLQLNTPPGYTKEKLTGITINFNSNNEPMILSGSNEVTRYNKDQTKLRIASAEFEGSAIRNFYIDREDVLWVCHDGNGVYKLSNTKLQSTNILPGKNISGIQYIKAFTPASVWMVTANNEWVFKTPAKTKLYRIKPGILISPLQHTKSHLYGVNAGKLFIAPLPKENDNVISFKNIVTLPDTSNFGGISVVAPDENIILFENRKLCVFKNDKQIFSFPVSSIDLIEGLYITKDNILWMVSRGLGFVAFSLHVEDTGHYLQKEFEYLGELADASPRCIAVDKNETLWIGTRYNGLLGFRYNNRQLKKLYHFQTQNGLTDNFVTSVACDGNDNLVVGMQTGIDRLLKNNDNTYHLENITKSNNIFAFINYVWTDINNNAFARTNAGITYQIESARMPHSTIEPQLLIEEMKVDGKITPINSGLLQLKYFQRNISFSVAAPTFIDEKQVKYSYLLSGSGNNQWSDTSSIADINLLNLSPGDYTLKVKAFFPSTSYSSKETAFSFLILPPWWKTVLFRLIAASFVMGLLITGTRFYYRRKLRQQRIVLEKQQAIEKERTRIATDMHDDLGAGLSRIKFLSETIGLKKQQQIPIEEDISKIREYSHEMIDKMGEIVWALNEKNDTLSDLLSYTRAYAVEYLSQNGIECNIESPEILPSDFVAGEFRRNIFLMVKEALHNIVKHAQASAVYIKISVDRNLNIEIKDNGIGFDKKNIRPFSNGITNMEKRIKELDGRLEISAIGGTTIKVNVPL